MTLRLTLNDALSFTAQVVTATPLLVAPFIAAGSVTLLFGPPSAGKTHLTVSLASALARGEALWGMFACATARVLIVQADMNTALYQERIRPNVDLLTSNTAILATDGMPLDVCKLSPTEPVIVAARALAPDIIFVDTLRKTHNFDENDSTAPDRVYTAWRTLFPGAALVFLHHSRKVSTQNANNDTILREAFRGSGAWAASADTILMLKRVRRANNPDWMTRLHFVRTRSCQEPTAVLLRLNDDLMLEPLAETVAEKQLLAWIATHPRAPKAEATAWLQTLLDDAGKPLCSRATAYRAYDRVTRGEQS